MIKKKLEVPLLPFDRDNWRLIGIGLVVITIGYLFLRTPPADSSWSLTVAPILLIAGYCVI
ncbi:MAG: hypothetical protein HY709_07180, partial [Candidatus Latescibacteria bacterium]|nr:hypothetical protein [Candidatus Latescibacterota bacterium]